MTTPAPITVRPATPGDVPFILGVITELAHYERLAHLLEVTPERLHDALFGPRPQAEALVACSGDWPIGYSFFWSTWSTFLGRPGIWIEDLAVTAAWRRRGAGTALLRAVAALAVERGCARLEWSVLDWNAPALALYQALGAEAQAEWTTQRVTGDALLRLARGGAGDG